MEEKIRRELEELRKEAQILNARIDDLSCRLDNKVKESNEIEAINYPIKMVLNDNVVNDKIDTNGFTPLVTEKYKNNRNFENNLGKNIMGILASILIFIGLSSFVLLIYPDLSDIVKFVLMLLFSLSVLGVGYWRVIKNSNNFSKAILSCGAGLVFISLLLSHFYFEYINQIVLFFLMLLWSGFSYLLYRKIKSSLFLIISYIGFSFSLILGSVSEYSTNLFTFALLFLLQVVYSYFLININKEENIKINYSLFFLSLGTSLLLSFIGFSQLDKLFYNMLSFSEIFYFISILILLFVNLKLINRFILNNKIKESNVLLLFLAVLFVNSNLLLTMGTNYTKTVGDSLEPMGSILVSTNIDSFEQVDNLELDILSTVMTNSYDYISLYLLLGILMHLIWIEKYKYREKYFKAYRFLLYLLVCSEVFIISLENYFSILVSLCGLLSISLLLLLYYKRVKNKSFVNLAVICYLVGLIIGCMEHSLLFTIQNPVFVLIFTILHILFLIYLNKIVEQQNSKGLNIFKYVVNIVSITFLMNVIGDYLGNLLSKQYSLAEKGNYLITNNIIHSDFLVSMGLDFTSILIFTFLSAYCLFFIYRRNFLRMKEEEKSLSILNKFVIFCLLIKGIALLYTIDYSGFLRFGILILTTLLCFTGIKDLVNSEKQEVKYYLCVKLTLFFNILLNVYFQNYKIDFIYSILCLVISIFCIIIGFKVKEKSYRLYGLGLSLFSVFKLILIDISYTDSITHSLSFIICGLLCFVIVWVYNKMSKSLSE